MRRDVRLVALAVVVAGFTACTRESRRPPVAQTGTDADSAEQVMFDVKTIMHNRGLKRGDLVADTAFVYNDQTRFLFRNPRATFTRDNGAPSGTLRAERGIYDLRQQVLEGFGDVEIITRDGKRLSSPHLKYDQIRNEVTSDTSFVLVDGDRRQEGIGFASDPNLTRFSCHRACRGSGTISIPAP